MPEDFFPLVKSVGISYKTQAVRMLRNLYGSMEHLLSLPSSIKSGPAQKYVVFNIQEQYSFFLNK